MVPSLLRSDICRFLPVLYSDLMSHAHKDTQHTLWPVDWHTHINIIYTTTYVLTAVIFITLNEYFTYTKNLLSTMPFLFKNYSLVKVCKIIHLLIRCYKTRFFLWNTNNTDRNSVNKQNKHTYTNIQVKHSEKDNTRKN